MRGKGGGWIAPEDFMGVNSDGSPRLDGLHATDIHRDPPRVSKSLDAVLAVAERVLPEHDWSVGCLPVSDEADHEEHHRFGALLYAHSRAASREDGLGHGATPALALCIAVLKATDTGREE
jgi:hypothetical protein